MAINPKNIIKLLEEEFPSGRQSAICESERELAKQISGIIKNGVLSSMQFEEDYELVYENPLLEDIEFSGQRDLADYLVEEEDNMSSEEVAQCSSSSSWHSTPVAPPKNCREDVPFSKRKQAVEYWRGSTQKRRKLSSVQHSFRFVQSVRQLELWETQIKKDGLRHEQICTVSTAVRKRFSDARNDKMTIHDEDLRRWALQESKKVGLNFKASESWVHHFKIKNRITSRKITKFVSKVAVGQEESIKKSANDFVKSIQEEMENFTPCQIFNTDQSGFNLELHSGRTLADKGDKHVNAVVQSVAATTHSYTIMPTITASGKLLSPLVIVTKEPNGKFGPVVEETMFKSKHILPIAAKSSMMGKEEIKVWFEKSFLPNTGEKSLLLVDSLNAYSAAKNASSKDQNITIKTIPPHTTGEVQPLDVFFFRPWKNFCRKVNDFVLIENIDFSLRNRSNIYKVQLLIHNQFCAPRFLAFRQYAWHKAGYFEEKPSPFINPVDYCLKSEEQVCSFPGCDDVKLLKCAWCEMPFCFLHSIINVHLHDVD